MLYDSTYKSYLRESRSQGQSVDEGSLGTTPLRRLSRAPRSCLLSPTEGCPHPTIRSPLRGNLLWGCSPQCAKLSPHIPEPLKVPWVLAQRGLFGNMTGISQGYTERLKMRKVSNNMFQNINRTISGLWDSK